MTRSPEVLVVVPVYGDIPATIDCLTALESSIDPGRHDVLVVNDCGPEVDAMERAVLDRIAGWDHFRYERNAENLGFVGTCNRAVFELDSTDADILLLNSDAVPTPGFLDELERVLQSDPRNGVVTARSNNATVASLPFRLTDPQAPRTFERTQETFDALSRFLPESYVVPVAMGFCLLTRRALVREYGLFDEAFAPGYGEENDYCLRVGEAGYRSLIVNRALVFHAGSKSFATKQRNRLRQAHQHILDRRYPGLSHAVATFLALGIEPADRFASCLVLPAGTDRRIALDLRFTVKDDAVRAATAFASAGWLPTGWQREVVVDATLVPDLDLDGVEVRTNLHPDDLVSVAVVPASDATPAMLLDAHRRGAVVARLNDPADPQTRLDSYRQQFLSFAVDPADVVEIDGALDDMPTFGAAVAAIDWSDLDSQVTALDRRHTVLTSALAARIDAELHIPRNAASLAAVKELQLIKGSGSYRLAQRISSVARRIRRR
jgi:GT2 family glycosyltransferase